MTVQTDHTLNGWKHASAYLGQETSIRIIAAVSKAARNIGASDDTEADALPHAFLGYLHDGVSIEQAAYQSVLSLHRKEQTRQSDPDFVSLDDVETSAQRDALEVAVQSSRDSVARSYGGGSRGELLPLSEALEAAPKGAKAIVTAVLTEAAQHSATRDYAGALYVPLKVSIVALAAGVARPRTKQASTDLRKAGCKAYAMVQALRDDSDGAIFDARTDDALDAAVVAYDAHVDSLTASAYRYVTRDRRAYGGHGLAVWNNGARPEDVDYSAYRPSSDFHPDIFNGSHVAPLQPVRGFRANTGTKGRRGPTPGQPSAGIAHGASAAMTPGPLFSATGGPNDAGLTAKRSLRSDTADLAAHEVHDARSQAKPCTRPIVTGESVVCGCGPTRGQVLISQTGTRVEISRNDVGQSVETESTVTWWTHALSVCPSPTVGTRGTSCGCGRKRGPLTAQNEHRAR